MTLIWCRCIRGGCALSYTVSYLFNDLVAEIEQTTDGFRLGERTVGILLYADDIVLIAETENDLNSTLNIVYCWCNKWRLEINKERVTGSVQASFCHKDSINT